MKKEKKKRAGKGYRSAIWHDIQLKPIGGLEKITEISDIKKFTYSNNEIFRISYYSFFGVETSGPNDMIIPRLNFAVYKELDGLMGPKNHRARIKPKLNKFSLRYETTYHLGLTKEEIEEKQLDKQKTDEHRLHQHREKFSLLAAIIRIRHPGEKDELGSMNWKAQGSPASIGISDCIVQI